MINLMSFLQIIQPYPCKKSLLCDPIKAFYRTTSNAVHCQIWIDICTYNYNINFKKQPDDNQLSLWKS